MVWKKKAQYKCRNCSQEPDTLISHKRADYDIPLFSGLYSFIFSLFFFFFHQLKEHKQRKILFSFTLGLKGASRDRIQLFVSRQDLLCKQTGSLKIYCNSYTKGREDLLIRTLMPVQFGCVLIHVPGSYQEHDFIIPKSWNLPLQPQGEVWNKKSFHGDCFSPIFFPVHTM